ncbi:hypothetical protein EVAR_27272_1 [Eumeta japonica]|uniref:Uncharacterized protein n=1 Tax=Eumeta variegata TaxID=151549 RepID=A0A4C1W2M3_EUMVA|nr:hypothetical protein EVAR_27272_1 [Eumeta japonica]
MNEGVMSPTSIYGKFGSPLTPNKLGPTCFYCEPREWPFFTRKNVFGLPASGGLRAGPFFTPLSRLTHAPRRGPDFR